ncbi:hypothetical protein EGW08_017015, partial [Elysia chlorotica]
RICKGRRRKNRVHAPIDDNVSEPKTGKSSTTPDHRAIPTEPFSHYDCIRSSDQENEAMHPYAIDFDPYDKIVEKIYPNETSNRPANVEPSQADVIAEQCLNDDESGSYIQMTDVQYSSLTPLHADYYTVHTFQTQQLGGNEGDYLTPLDDLGETEESEFMEPKVEL